MGEASVPVPARSITMVLPRALIAALGTRLHDGPPPVSRESFLRTVVSLGFDTDGLWRLPLGIEVENMLTHATRYPELAFPHWRMGLHHLPLAGATDESAVRRAVVELKIAAVVASVTLTNQSVTRGFHDSHPVVDPWTSCALACYQLLRDGQHEAARRALSLFGWGTHHPRDSAPEQRWFSTRHVAGHLDRLQTRPTTLASWLADNPDLTDGLVGDLLAGVWRGDPVTRDQLGNLLAPLTTHDYPFAAYLAETLASPEPRHPQLRPRRRALESLASPDELLHGSGVPDIEVLRASQPDGVSRNVLGGEVKLAEPLTFFTASPELAGLIAVAKRSGGALTMCTHVLDDDTVGVSVGMSREVKLAALRGSGTVYRVPASACEPLEGKIGEYVAYDDVPVVGSGLTVAGTDVADLLIGLPGPRVLGSSHQLWASHSPCSRGGTFRLAVKNPSIRDWPVPCATYDKGRWRFWIGEPRPSPTRNGARRRPGGPSH